MVKVSALVENSALELNLASFYIMDSFSMSSEVNLFLKGLVAQFTGKGFNPGVFPHVSDQITALTEGL